MIYQIQLNQALDSENGTEEDNEDDMCKIDRELNDESMSLAQEIDNYRMIIILQQLPKTYKGTNRVKENQASSICSVQKTIKKGEFENCYRILLLTRTNLVTSKQC